MINWDDQYEGEDPGAVRQVREEPTGPGEVTFLESEEKRDKCSRKRGVTGRTW